MSVASLILNKILRKDVAKKKAEKGSRHDIKEVRTCYPKAVVFHPFFFRRCQGIEVSTAQE